VRIPGAARRTIEAAQDHARSLGVEMVVEWQDEQKRLTFLVHRNAAPKGSGAAAIRRLVELADEADLEVCLDVLDSSTRLVRYYWQFGFRICDGDPASETAGLAEMEAEQARIRRRARPDAEIDYGVEFMWRDRWAGPMIMPDDTSGE
jgi:hypothetical protein